MIRGHIAVGWLTMVFAGCVFEISSTGPVLDAPAVDAAPDASAVPPVQLSSISLWSAPSTPLGVGLSPVFDPARASYAAPVSVFQRSVLVSAVPIDPSTTLTIDGVAVGAGVESAPIALAPGSNPIAIVARASDGTEATYSVDVARSQLTQEAYLKASDTFANDEFGSAIAMSGDTLVVGAPLQDGTATTAGAAYVFVRTGSTWTQQAYLKASNPDSGDRFGSSVTIDGDTLAVGAPFEDSNASGVGGNQGDNGRSNSGAVYVFTRTGATWTQEAYIKASNSGSGDRFGYWSSLSGNTLAVSAPLEDSRASGIDGIQTDNGALDSGAAYVFTRTGTTWSQQAYVKASNPDTLDHLGYNLTVDGDTLVVGAEHEDSAAIGQNGNQGDNSAIDSGAAYVFTRTGTTWTQQAYLKASNTEAGDGFGDSIAIVGDLLVIGARMEDSAAVSVDGDGTDNGAPESGAAYVFRSNRSGHQKAGSCRSVVNSSTTSIPTRSET